MTQRCTRPKQKDRIGNRSSRCTALFLIPGNSIPREVTSKLRRATFAGLALLALQACETSNLIPVVAPEAPVIHPDPGPTYSQPFTAWITPADKNTLTIFVTTDGSSPSREHGTEYWPGERLPITQQGVTTVSAIAYSDTGLASPIATARFRLLLPTVAEPTFDPPAGAYVGVQHVTVSSATQGASVWCTTDGSQPSPGTPSQLCTSPLRVDKNMTIRAVATKTNMNESSVVEALYKITLPTADPPIFTPPPGSYVDTTVVVGSTQTPGGEVWCTVASPTQPAGAFARCDTPITLVADNYGQVSLEYTIEAYTKADGYIDSPVETLTYNIEADTACAADGYTFKCKVTKGDLVNYAHAANPVPPYRFNNEIRWAPKTSPFATSSTKRVWNQDWGGNSPVGMENNLWAYDPDPNSPLLLLFDAQWNTVGYAVVHICSFANVATQDAGWKVTDAAMSIPRTGIEGWWESQDQYCDMVLSLYNATSPAYLGSGESYLAVYYSPFNGTLTPAISPDDVWIKVRNNP
jgi:hypothetical protein